MVEAQLVERLLLTPEVHFSNPVISKFYLLSTVLKLYWKAETKEKETGNGSLNVALKCWNLNKSEMKAKSFFLLFLFAVQLLSIKNIFVSSLTGHLLLLRRLRLSRILLLLIFEIFVWTWANYFGLDNYNLKGQMWELWTTLKLNFRSYTFPLSPTSLSLSSYTSFHLSVGLYLSFVLHFSLPIVHSISVWVYLFLSPLYLFLTLTILHSLSAYLSSVRYISLPIVHSISVWVYLFLSPLYLFLSLTILHSLSL